MAAICPAPTATAITNVANAVATTTPNLCAGCRRPILDRFYLRMDRRNWHEDCVKCCACNIHLRKYLYVKDDNMYCYPDYRK